MRKIIGVVISIILFGHSAFAGTCLEDHFTDTNGTSLPSHLMDVGPGQVVNEAGWIDYCYITPCTNGVWEIESNQASENNTTSGSRVTAVADSGKTNQTISVDVAVPASNDYANCVIGASTGDQQSFDGICLEDDGTGCHFYILEVTSNVGSAHGSVSCPSDPHGTTVTINVTFNGASISGSDSLGDSISYGSASYTSGTYAGFLTFYFSGSPRFDQGIFDNWLVTNSGCSTSSHFKTVNGVNFDSHVKTIDGVGAAHIKTYMGVTK